MAKWIVVSGTASQTSPLTTSRQETEGFFFGKTKQSQRKELPREKAEVPPTVNSSSWQLQSHRQSFPWFFVPFSQCEHSAKDYWTCEQSSLTGERNQKRRTKETDKKKRQRKEQKKSIIICLWYVRRYSLRFLFKWERLPSGHSAQNSIFHYVLPSYSV